MLGLIATLIYKQSHRYKYTDQILDNQNTLNQPGKDQGQRREG
jgi:hypothetical protein